MRLYVLTAGESFVSRSSRIPEDILNMDDAATRIDRMDEETASFLPASVLPGLQGS